MSHLNDQAPLGAAVDNSNSLAYDEKKDATILDDEHDLKVQPGWGEANEITQAEEKHVQHDLAVLGDELHDLEDKLDSMTLERTVKIVKELRILHRHDQNFPGAVLERMNEFLEDPDVIGRPEKHGELIREMKLEALLSTENSPYVEVRANVDPVDDVTTPCFTFRVWVIGCIFSAAGCFIDVLFGYRNPPIFVGTNVGQLLAFPAGKFMEKVVPAWSFTVFGRKMSLNPGPFNRKEHALITIMANVSFGAPYTNYIVPVQALPVFFGQSWAFDRGYQFINTIGTTFVGYGMAGLTRRFLVYPSVALWPSSLVTIGLIKAFHTETNEPVKGPGGMWRMSRQKFFLWSFLAMFVYYFFPGYIFQALSYFSWMTWISPNNAKLTDVTGFISGMGLNPWPTFDWNNLTIWLSPLTVPTFSIMNNGVGILIGAIMCLAVYYTNSWNTGYIPINSNSAFDNTANPYNVTKILDPETGLFNYDMYQEYSEPWMSAGFVVSYLWYFALYSATATYVVLYHRHDIAVGFRGLYKSIRKLFKKRDDTDEDDLSEDIHYRLMQAYPEVHEWQYMLMLAISLVFGMVGVGAYPTGTSPVVVIFGIIFTLIAMIPSGLIYSVTGIQVPLNVLAEFIGGSMVEGNANALNYFKTYGYISANQAILFSNDLKIAHYLKIPPRATFWAQTIATAIFCIVSSSVFNFAMSFKDVCTPEAQFRFSCPNQRTFFTAAVFWGTISPNRLFGPGKRYNLMLLGFPLGVIMVLGHWLMRRKWPRSEFLRQVHPVMLTAGPSTWGSPYNFSYFVGNIYVVWFSFQFIRKRYLAFWVKYNYVIAAAFPAGIAISALVIFFGLSIPKGGELEIDWWGNNVVGLGCDGAGGCPALEVPADPGYFGVAPGSGKFT